MTPNVYKITYNGQIDVIYFIYWTAVERNVLSIVIIQLFYYKRN